MNRTLGNRKKYLRRQWAKIREGFWSRYRQLILVVMGSTLMIGVIYIVMVLVIYSDRYQILSISIDHQGATIDSTVSLDREITSRVQDYQSYLDMRWFHWRDIISDIRQQYPLVQQVRLTDFLDNELRISVIHHQPELIRRIPQGGPTIGSYDEYLYPLDEDQQLTGARELYVPNYFSGTSIDGIYHHIDEESFVSFYDAVSAVIPVDIVVIHPGAGYAALTTTDGLKILFSLQRSIEDQLQLYSDVYQYYDQAYRIRQIDVGSLETPIVTLDSI